MVLASKEVVTVALLCCVWYVVSSGSNVVGKTLLNQFPYPMTVTMVQLLSIAIYSGPFFNLWGVRRFVDISWPYYFKLIVPLALGKFVGSVFTHVSLWKVPVSYTHTGNIHYFCMIKLMITLFLTPVTFFFSKSYNAVV